LKINASPENTVLVSYAWGAVSERIVNNLVNSFSESNIRVVRDEKSIDYKDSISKFVQRIEQNQAVILVISDKYLRSEHCMYELVEIEKNTALRERIFPVVLSDAQIYTSIGRLSYIKYWDEKITQLNKVLKQVVAGNNLSDITAELEKYSTIRASFDRLTHFLSSMNALTPQTNDVDFSALIKTIEGTMVNSEQSSDEVTKKTLHLKMDGKAFQKGIYIHTVVDSLNELQFILDRSYLALADRKNLTPKERTRYRLVAQSFEKGSFVSAIDIVLATAPVVLPLISQIGPENIWEYTKTTFEFLKLVFSLNQEKKLRNDDKPINITGDEATTNVNYGEQTWNFNAPVLMLGESVLPSYKKLSQLIKLNDIEFLQLGSSEKEPEIRLDQNDSHRFDVKPEILKTPVAIECEIFDINKDKGHGKLRVVKKQGIPSGEYNFVIAKSRKTKNKKLEFVQSMLEEKLIVECWKEILFDPFSPECTKIIKLHLLSVQAL